MGEERERCGEFGTKAAACIVNGKLHGVSRLDCVSLVVVHMAEFTHSSLTCFCFGFISQQ